MDVIRHCRREGSNIKDGDIWDFKRQPSMHIVKGMNKRNMHQFNLPQDKKYTLQQLMSQLQLF